MQSGRYLLRPSRIQIISDLGKGQCSFLKFMYLTHHRSVRCSQAPFGVQGMAVRVLCPK